MRTNHHEKRVADQKQEISLCKLISYCSGYHIPELVFKKKMLQSDGISIGCLTKGSLSQFLKILSLKRSRKPWKIWFKRNGCRVLSCFNSHLSSYDNNAIFTKAILETQEILPRDFI